MATPLAGDCNEQLIRAGPITMVPHACTLINQSWNDDFRQPGTSHGNYEIHRPMGDLVLGQALRDMVIWLKIEYLCATMVSHWFNWFEAQPHIKKECDLHNGVTWYVHRTQHLTTYNTGPTLRSAGIKAVTYRWKDRNFVRRTPGLLHLIHIAQRTASCLRIYIK